MAVSVSKIFFSEQKSKHGLHYSIMAGSRHPIQSTWLFVTRERENSWGLSSMENGRPPDPADWAVRDVVNYFRTAGFEEQAGAFQEQP
ncbi:sterile alpha motif domain-containing protein 13 isoform X2 [Mastomys coucha]|uniref:sterile alpha motif domain-containing protein 13 isoform X1 n=1 Tax=Mastomys coucha TaxID=35658 RepID=UPI001262874C|nr:sterile alpha motif domain-containing protein 13 isoform X1 [Mastomys coucha]XP_031231640.1 sterile alpha motif domain-containing protein 13 isoform X2 [Mastomys coucha]XP_031231641.1 sterile alpha motif domain-containing protein 13 isoform X2 [Mastomys coucha]